MADGRQFEQAEWVWGACAGAAVYRRSMLDDIGLFDEDFFAYMEDIDLSFRAQLLGYKCIYAPSAIIYHKVSATSGRHSSQRLYWSHRNHWYVLIKNLPSSLWLRYLPQIVMAELLIFLSAFKNKQLRTFVGARIEVCRMTPKMLQKRKEIQQRCRVSIRYIDSLIRQDWFSFRLELKRREKEYQDQTNK